MSVSARPAWLATLIIALLIGIHVLQPPAGGLWLQTVYDSTHVFVFGIVGIAVLYLTPIGWTPRRRFFVSCGCIIVLALVSELAQIPTQRDAALKDLLSDVLGGVGVVCIVMALANRIRRWWLGGVLLGATLIVIPLLPVAMMSVAYLERAHDLPKLARFDSHFSHLLISAQNAELGEIENPRTGEHSVIIMLGHGRWPGISFDAIWPDWEPYSGLSLSIENPELEPLLINIRVHDQQHQQDLRFDDRFNRQLTLKPGRQTLTIPLRDIQNAPTGRLMQLSKIDGVVLFATEQETGRRFILHELTLLGSAE